MLKGASGVALVVVVAAASAGPGMAAFQESRSAPLARQLSLALDAAKIDAIAASDPSTGGFVAALYIPGTQLLVVSGKFEAPAIGSHRISKKEFRELYMDLMGASVAGSRMFAADVSCDGFVYDPEGDAPADTWEAGSVTHAFAGPKKGNVSGDEYRKTFSEADRQYAHILALLLAETKPKID